MLFNTAGHMENPVIVMINGSFTTGNIFREFAETYLADDFYVICPTYDGHHAGGTVFDSRAGQAAKIARWLREQSIREIALLQGLSMGAEVALELMKQLSADGSITVNRCFLDGGPFFRFPAVFRKFMYLKFRKVITMGQKGNTEDLMNSPLVKWIVHGDIEPYRAMAQGMPVDVITDETIRNETEACYTFDFPPFDEKDQKKLLFSWSSDEPANKSAKAVRRHYPYAEYKSAGAMGHGGFILREPGKYARLMRRLAQPSAIVAPPAMPSSV